MPAPLIHPHGTHKSRKSNFSPEFQHQFLKLGSVPLSSPRVRLSKNFSSFEKERKNSAAYLSRLRFSSSSSSSPSSSSFDTFGDDVRHAKMWFYLKVVFLYNLRRIWSDVMGMMMMLRPGCAFFIWSSWNHTAAINKRRTAVVQYNKGIWDTDTWAEICHGWPEGHFWHNRPSSKPLNWCLVHTRDATSHRYQTTSSLNSAMNMWCLSGLFLSCFCLNQLKNQHGQ